MITQISVLRAWARARLNVTEQNERGANLVEYILLIAFIALLVVVAITGLKTAISDKFDTSKDCLNNAPAC
jgi:Flp pilus assembly pilin Flp